MLLDHGFSARCEGCRASLEGKPSQNHSEECRKRILEAIGSKDALEVEAQRKRFDAFIDKAAAKEDSEELKREKKRVRFEEQTSGPEKSDADNEVQTETHPNSSSRTEVLSSIGSSSSSSKRGPTEDAEYPERGVRAKVREKRGQKRERQRIMAVQTWTRHEEKRGRWKTTQQLDQESP